MAKPEQVLVIEPPSELHFKGPFTSQVTSFLTLSNPIDKKVFFKIKTTAPKKYCVRPNSGSLDPNKSVDVAVSLQPFDYDPAEKNKHKFMVQSVVAPDGEYTPENIWLSTRQQDSMDSKLKCVFDMPIEDRYNEEPATGDETRKRITEVKAAPKPSPDSAGDATKEVKALRQEESNMRQQNMALKEEMLRLQKEMANVSGQQRSAVPVLQDNPQARTMSDLVIIIVIGLVGIIIGKFFL